LSENNIILWITSFNGLLFGVLQIEIKCLFTRSIWKESLSPYFFTLQRNINAICTKSNANSSYVQRKFNSYIKDNFFFQKTLYTETTFYIWDENIFYSVMMINESKRKETFFNYDSNMNQDVFTRSISIITNKTVYLINY
jgi:hypothetical protein